MRRSSRLSSENHRKYRALIISEAVFFSNVFFLCSQYFCILSYQVTWSLSVWGILLPCSSCYIKLFALILCLNHEKLVNIKVEWTPLSVVRLSHREGERQSVCRRYVVGSSNVWVQERAFLNFFSWLCPVSHERGGNYRISMDYLWLFLCWKSSFSLSKVLFFVSLNVLKG